MGVLGLVVALLVVGVPLARMIGKAQQTPSRTGSDASVPPASGSTAPPQGPVPTAVGNLLSNWSFEQDLSGWQGVGPVSVVRELGGRTSGSSAFVQATTNGRTPVGIVAASVVPEARAGVVYEASVWVRSGTPGLEVALSLVVTHGGTKEASRTVAETVSDPRWLRVDVAHRVTAPGTLAVQVTADGLSQGEGFLVDEVTVRQA
ncbi:MAG TPA: hypothetical protein VEP73_07970 [Actinomycetota bacterium]|nr:hypothetical protein [Actinomycetota bacterium]